MITNFNETFCTYFQDVPAVDISFSVFERYAPSVPKFLAISSGLILFVIAILSRKLLAKLCLFMKNTPNVVEKSGLSSKCGQNWIRLCRRCGLF